MIIKKLWAREWTTSQYTNLKCFKSKIGSQPSMILTSFLLFIIGLRIPKIRMTI
jgi:hypothetical protein